MPSVFKTTATWNGFIGAPGYTKFAWIDLATTASYTAATDGMRAFFAALTTYLYLGTSIQVAQILQEYDAATGTLLAEHSASTLPAVVNGVAAASAHPGGAGAFISWKTGQIYNGRRVQGRSFIVPIAASCYDTDGTLASGFTNALQTAGDNLVNIALADFAVWAKTWSKPVPPNKPVQIGGQGFSVQNAQVKDQASGLRSRRL